MVLRLADWFLRVTCGGHMAGHWEVAKNGLD